MPPYFSRILRVFEVPVLVNPRLSTMDLSSLSVSPSPRAASCPTSRPSSCPRSLPVPRRRHSLDFYFVQLIEIYFALIFFFPVLPLPTLIFVSFCLHHFNYFVLSSTFVYLVTFGEKKKGTVLSIGELRDIEFEFWHYEKLRVDF